MPYLDTWDDFAKVADRLYSQAPWKASTTSVTVRTIIYSDCFKRFQVRFTVKYRHCDGWLVLKVTDDKSVSGGSGLNSFLRYRLRDAIHFIFLPHSVSSIGQTSSRM